MRLQGESGAAAILVTAAMVFLVGAAALAVDVSGFYHDARTDQTTADLTCLAGVAKLPADQATAFDTAAGVAKLNWSAVAESSLSATGSPTVKRLADANGNVVELEVGFGGNPAKMRVTVIEQSPTRFARVIGARSVTVTQEAVCQAEPAAGGPGMLPVAALAGSFSGDLFDCAAKVTGNCGAVDAGSGANDWRDALRDGLDGKFEKHHGAWTSADADTGHAGTVCAPPFGAPCNANDTETGNMVGPFNQGMQLRLSDISDADCIQGGDFNCDSLAQVIHGASASPAIPTLFSMFGASAPSWWVPSLYGPYASAMNSQFYYDGDIEKCDSPRLATVPIMNFSNGSGVPNNWNIGGPQGTWPNGKKTMKIIGFYTVYIREPDNRGDVGNGNGNGLNQIVADVVWFDPNATCDGQPVNFFGEADPASGGIKLVAG